MAKEKMSWGSWESILNEYLEPSAWINVKWNGLAKPTGKSKTEVTTKADQKNPNTVSDKQFDTSQLESVRDFLVRRKSSTTLYDKFDSEIWSKIKIQDKDFYKDFLLKMAALESDFKPSAEFKNKKNPDEDALGMYQILHKFIKHYTQDPNMTKEKFLKDPVVQTEAAIRMAKQNYRILSSDKNKDYLEDLAKSGFDIWDAMAAGWLAGANGSIASWRGAKETGKFKEDDNGTDTNERMIAFKQLTV